MTISEKIYALRIKRGLSQKEFAERVGASQSAVNYWENGKRIPKLIQLQKIASAFDITLDSLMSEKPSVTAKNLHDFFEVVAGSYISESGEDGDIHFTTEEFTLDELDEIYKFAEFLKSKRKATDQ